MLKRISTVERTHANQDIMDEEDPTHLNGIDIDSSDIDSKIGLAINGEYTDKKKKKGKKGQD